MGLKPLNSENKLAEKVDKNTADYAIEFMRIRLEGCRKGGIRSGKARCNSGKRTTVEHAISSQVKAGAYNRDTASKIAKYLNVSPRYVRKLAISIQKKEEL